MFLIKFLIFIVAGVCRLLIIIGLSCYLFTVTAGSDEGLLNEASRENGHTILSSSYDYAATQIDTAWQKLQQYEIVIVKKSDF